jgi:hypothetical protein
MRMRWAMQVERRADEKRAQNFGWKRLLGKPTLRWEDNTEINFKEI